MMTRKHFKALASELAHIRPEDPASNDYATWVASCNAVAVVCKQDNYRFDTGKFLTACKEW